MVRYFRLSAALAVPLLPMAAQAAPKEKTLTEAELVAVITQREHDAIAPATMEELRAVYSPDVIDFTPSDYFQGFSKLLDNFAHIAPGIKDWKVWIVPGSMKIVATQEMAVASTLQHWQASYVDTSKPAMDMFYRQTDVWQKIAGKWVIVSAHSSLPIDPITERIYCTEPDGYCPLPNYPHKVMDAGVARKMLKESYSPASATPTTAVK